MPKLLATFCRMLAAPFKSAFIIVIMSRKKGTVIYLSEEDKAKLEKIAANWGVSQSSATQRLIREYKLD